MSDFLLPSPQSLATLSTPGSPILLLMSTSFRFPMQPIAKELASPKPGAIHQFQVGISRSTCTCAARIYFFFKLFWKSLPSFHKLEFHFLRWTHYRPQNSSAKVAFLHSIVVCLIILKFVQQSQYSPGMYDSWHQIFEVLTPTFIDHPSAWQLRPQLTHCRTAWFLPGVIQENRMVHKQKVSNSRRFLWR